MGKGHYHASCKKRGDCSPPYHKHFTPVDNQGPFRNIAFSVLAKYHLLQAMMSARTFRQTKYHIWCAFRLQWHRRSHYRRMSTMSLFLKMYRLRNTFQLRLLPFCGCFPFCFLSVEVENIRGNDYIPPYLLRCQLLRLDNSTQFRFVLSCIFSPIHYCVGQKIQDNT